MPIHLSTPTPEIHWLPPLLSEGQLLASMGIQEGMPVKKRLQRHVEETLPIVKEHANPKILWKTLSLLEIEASFPPSRRLARFLDTTERVAILAGTAGKEWDLYRADEPDPMKAYIFSAAATALARTTLKFGRAQISEDYPNNPILTPISPGNDGLPLSLQTAFGQLLPLNSIGINLDPDSLFMLPLASVTALIGIGPRCENQAPALIDDEGPRCCACPSPACDLRLEPFESKLQDEC